MFILRLEDIIADLSSKVPSGLYLTVNYQISECFPISFPMRDMGEV